MGQKQVKLRCFLEKILKNKSKPQHTQSHIDFRNVEGGLVNQGVANFQRRYSTPLRAKCNFHHNMFYVQTSNIKLSLQSFRVLFHPIIDIHVVFFKSLTALLLVFLFLVLKHFPPFPSQYFRTFSYGKIFQILRVPL